MLFDRRNVIGGQVHALSTLPMRIFVATRLDDAGVLRRHRVAVVAV